MAPGQGLLLGLLLLLVTLSECKKKASSASDVIEEVDRKKLEKLVHSEEYLAVFFYTKSCKDCGVILEELERIDDDAGNFGVAFVKNSEKSTAKKYGVTSFPALMYFRNQQPAIFEGDLKNEEKVLAWLTDLDSMELPDKIEEVNAKILENLIEDSDFLAVLLYKEDCELSEKVLQELENIDDEADAKDIGFVKIADENLAVEYGLDSLPALVYYRKKIPLLYDGDLFNEEEVLNWLFEFQDLGEESEAIEDVSANSLMQMIEESPMLAVLFYDLENRRSQRILEELESIDDDTDRHGIPFVKIDDDKVAAEFGIDTLPALVFFEKQMPNFYKGDLTKEEDVLDWLIKQTSSDEIEDVTDKVLQHMIKKAHELAVLFYDNEDENCLQILHELENIDDDADKLGIPFVKIEDQTLAEAYGITTFPTLVFFENQVPNFYKGNLTSEEVVLDWLKELKESDEIEAVSDQVIELMIDKCDYLAILFYNTEDAAAQKAINELENIDDESDKAGIPLVRSESKVIPDAYGISVLPALVYFENGVPNIYPGDLSIEEEVLKWLLEQQSSDEIEDVTSKVLEQMITKTEHLAVLFYDKNDRKSMDVLRELEHIDDEADEEGMSFVRIEDKVLAAEYGIDDDLPALVYFEKRIPSVYQGDLTNEQQVWKWLHLQLTSDGIEEVTEKILFNIISHNQFVAVLFYDHKSKKSAKVLKELETIDDDADQYDILIVKNDNFSAAQKYGLKKLPALMFFKEGSPIVFEGNLMKEEEVLQWLIDQLANDEIEDINENTLENLIENNPYVSVFFYDNTTKSEQILRELENIDDDTDRHGIPFVRIEDDSVAKEYGILDELPILVYFEDRIPSVYKGDLMKEEEVLAWIIRNKEEDTIEEVNDEILEDMIKEYEYVLVFFAPDGCPDCEKILTELENIDDETDDHGIMFVTTDQLTIAKKQAKVNKFPAVVLFRNGVPIVYKGNLKDEDALLKWVTSEEALDIPDKIEEVNTRMLDKLLDTSPYVAVLFYKEGNPECDKVLAELENIDDDAETFDIDFVKISDPEITEEYSIVSFPTLVFFRKRFPQFYEGDLMDEEKALKWLVENKEKKDDMIDFVDKKMIDVLLDDVDHIVIYFYEKGCAECDIIISELEKIDVDAKRHGIHFVKTDDVRLAEELGVTEFPTLVYFEHKIPSIFSGDLMNENQVLEWLMKEKNEDTIENINREMLFKLIEDHEFLAVYFYLENDKESENVAVHLEKIDDDCSEYDVHLVKMTDKVMAKKHGVKNPPGLVFFRNGNAIKYPGKLKDEEEVLEWLTSPENMAVSDIIEKVNKRMFERILHRFDYVAVFFYSKVGCKTCAKVLDELEKVDSEAEAEGIHIVKIDDSSFAKKYGVFAFPAILFFRGPEAEPIIYAGDMKNGDRMLDWLLTQKDPSADIIEEIEGDELRNMIETADHLAVFFYDKNLCSNCDNENIDTMECEDCQIIMDELENIDDDTDRNGIQFVKTTDLSVAKHYGIKITPALVYYENQAPSIFEGDLADEDEVLDWLLHQKSEDTIETVNKAMLEKLIEEIQYLAVFFYKPHCRACEVALLELENIDDDTDLYGISVVRIYDIQVSKRYGIKTFPALVYFRNGNPLIYDGDLKNEESVLEWLIDDDNRELPDEIETINIRMLNKLVEESPFLAVYFSEVDCYECERVLMELENIDDECDIFGIDLVKIFDPEARRQYNVETVPAIAFFRKQVAMFYEGDLYDEETLLKWLTSNDVFEIENEIEEVNRKMLEKLLEENEFVAVFFYENNCEKCDEALGELERIDDEADDLDIMFLKIKDPRYAKKFGIAQLPSLVYFRKKFPSVYKGNLLEEEEVLDWLRKNRYRHPELNLFMYGLAAISLSFVLYTIVLIYCFNKNKDKKE
ncbi:uncharacterized protein LOC129227940 [Uloborus diversus]|uniref:uncharacterized protein LOC129227940 n=1 Tax=Uloborus diversus TaxID=327109 RepID=UPI00240908AD|nr:uncharacterized protein LOC129227940 [Uloborus diversus]